MSMESAGGEPGHEFDEEKERARRGLEIGVGRLPGALGKTARALVTALSGKTPTPELGPSLYVDVPDASSATVGERLGDAKHPAVLELERDAAAAAVGEKAGESKGVEAERAVTPEIVATAFRELYIEPPAQETARFMDVRGLVRNIEHVGREYLEHPERTRQGLDKTGDNARKPHPQARWQI